MSTQNPVDSAGVSPVRVVSASKHSNDRLDIRLDLSQLIKNAKIDPNYPIVDYVMGDSRDKIKEIINNQLGELIFNSPAIQALHGGLFEFVKNTAHALLNNGINNSDDQILILEISRGNDNTVTAVCRDRAGGFPLSKKTGSYPDTAELHNRPVSDKTSNMGEDGIRTIGGKGIGVHLSAMVVQAGTVGSDNKGYLRLENITRGIRTTAEGPARYVTGAALIFTSEIGEPKLIQSTIEDFLTRHKPGESKMHGTKYIIAELQKPSDGPSLALPPLLMMRRGHRFQGAQNNEASNQLPPLVPQSPNSGRPGH